MSDFVISEPVDPRDLPAVTPEEEAEFVASRGVAEPVEDEDELLDAEEQLDVEPEVNDDPRDLGDLTELIDGVDVEDVDIEGLRNDE